MYLTEMRQISWLVLLSVFLSCGTRAADVAIYPPEALPAGMQPVPTDLRSVIPAVKAEGKKGILLYFGAINQEDPGIEYDFHRLTKMAFATPSAKSFYNQNFAMFFVNSYNPESAFTDFQGNRRTITHLREPRTGEKDLDSAWSVASLAWPVFLFFDADGNFLAKHIGGLRPKDDEAFLLGKYVISGAYRSQSFGKYKKANGKR